jgi:hypothetical protein
MTRYDDDPAREPFGLSRQLVSTNDYTPQVRTGPIVWEGGQSEEFALYDSYFADCGQINYWVSAPVLGGINTESDNRGYDPSRPWCLEIMDLISPKTPAKHIHHSVWWFHTAEHAMNAAVTHARTV